MGQSILDFVRGDVSRLRPRWAPAEQQKLDQHLTSLRELEKQLQPIAAASAGAASRCGGAVAPDASKFPKLKGYNGGEPYFDAITDVQIDLLAQAIACDITRFGTLLMNDLSFRGQSARSARRTTTAASPTPTTPRPSATTAAPAQGDPETWLPLAKFNTYSYSKVARLMQKLDALGALDSTLIYVSSDMGNPALHSTHNVPTLLCGGGGGKFRMGRRLRLGQDCSDGTPWCGPGEPRYSGVSNNHLLVSIAQAFGVNLDSFGSQVESKHTTGALSLLA